MDSALHSNQIMGPFTLAKKKKRSCQAQTRCGVLLLPFLSWLSLESSLYSTAYHMSSRNMADKGHVWSDDSISLLIHV